MVGFVYFEFWRQAKSFPHLSWTDEKLTTGVWREKSSIIRSLLVFMHSLVVVQQSFSAYLHKIINQDKFLNVSLVLGCWLGQALRGRPSCQYFTGKQSSFFAIIFVVKYYLCTMVGGQMVHTTIPPIKATKSIVSSNPRKWHCQISYNQHMRKWYSTIYIELGSTGTFLSYLGLSLNYLDFW